MSCHTRRGFCFRLAAFAPVLFQRSLCTPLKDLGLSGNDTANASPAGHQAGTDFIDVRDLMRKLSVEDLCRTAEEYWAKRPSWDYSLSKPLNSPSDAPMLLMRFAKLVQSLRLVPDMTVLDFGAGACWASRWLTQMGLRVIALDVSATALKIGKTLYARQPVFGKQPPPKFLVFNGRKIDLPDGSVDRIICFDTFHHVPNPAEVLAEMSRILVKGGTAGFAEPGPNHSKSPLSQAEMRHYRVLENDINIREIWFTAKKVGFARMELAVFNGDAFNLSLPQFEDFLSGGSSKDAYFRTTRRFIEGHRIFFLHKEGRPSALDSRQCTGLLAELSVALASARVRQGKSFVADVQVTNRGGATWLPATAPMGGATGGVLLGCHLLELSGEVIKIDFFRHPLTSGEGRPIRPGERLKFHVELPALPKGRYKLEFDLVSERVCWFSRNGSRTVEITVEVF
jgi:ubiquinone/menaquinone biosynthesis C-methylase UbiE